MPGSRVRASAAALGSLAFVAVIAFAAQLGRTPVVSGTSSVSGDNPGAIDAQTELPQETAHVHEWAPVLETVDVPEATHVVHHEAQVERETRYETVCCACNAVVTGATRKHTAETGHASFTSDVPITDDIVVANAWDEVVVDSPARQELRHAADRCVICGAQRSPGSATEEARRSEYAQGNGQAERASEAEPEA